MSRRSSVFTRLPLKVRRRLDQRLIANGFSGYAELTEWLDRLGYPVSKSALNRYGIELEHRERELSLARASEQLGAFADLSEKDGATTVRGLLRLVQTQIFTILTNSGGEFEIGDLTRLTRIIIDLARVALAQHAADADQPSHPSSPQKAHEDGDQPNTDSPPSSRPSDSAIDEIRDLLLGSVLPVPKRA